MDHFLEWSLAILYLLIGPGAWCVFWFAMIKGRARLRIRPSPLPTLDREPPVTVVVPCKNEETHITACVDSILKQDWPDFELIVVNDRSTDRTGEVLDELAARDPRLRVIHVREGELPEGWFGKTHALHLGSQAARGDWILHTDSDCLLAPNAVRVGVVTGVAREFDMVSFCPHFVGRGFWDSMMTPLGGIVTSAMYTMQFANSTHVPSVAFACGQYMAIRKDILQKVGGWEAVRHVPADDVEMAKLLKSTGHRPRIGWGMDLVQATMYDSFARVWRGWGRNFIAATRGKSARVLLGALVVLLCVFSIYPAIAWGIYRQIHPINAFGGLGWLATALVHAVLMTLGLISAYSWGKSDWRYAFAWPISSVLLLAIFARSVYLCLTGKLDWRGVNYSLRQSQSA